jgi:hypothetical protein
MAKAWECAWDDHVAVPWARVRRQHLVVVALS